MSDCKERSNQAPRSTRISSLLEFLEVLKAKPHVDFGVRGSRIRYMVEKIIKTFFFSRLGYHFQGFIGGFSGQVLVS
ncbi:hypothetical protein POPTR_010G150601v4 [Populus trichocarpa]|uniref:Uncharacterized protein n=1 Tax=Populus trichocarpa TaxID=3694 RepID=A0ACC0SDJ9_POPTR|nr:hypothetical protein POPTR_010G150601v4 [Populus trichocarpa]